MASKNINDMPYSVRRKICQVLDIGDEWKLLAAEIGFNVDKIQHLELSFRRQGGSATSDLLTSWSHSNASLEMLASFLLKLDLRRAAEYLRGHVPDSMFDTDSSDNPNNNISGADQDLPSLPKPSQMTDDIGLPLPCLRPAEKAVDYRQLPEVVYQSEPEKQKMNIATTNSDSLKLDKTSNLTNTIPRETWSENMTPGFEFDLSAQYGKHSNELWSSGSDVFKRRPEETTDVPSLALNNSATRTDVSSNRRPADNDAAALLNFIICYNYVDIMTATNNFHRDNLLGCGGFGSVYRGNIKKTTFAIKVLRKREQLTSCRDFLAEINSLLKFRQKNIIMLSGCSVDGPAPCLVYEYMVNGSLQDRLECKNNTKPLPWNIRHGVLKDAAAGLQYLHTVDVKPLIHGDVKSGNILLGPHYEGKISDFGLAKEATGGSVTGKFTHVTRDDRDKVYGSKAYLPEEFFTGGFQFNIKTDTYSFGIVIFETCTGEAPDDSRREGGRFLGEYVRNIMDSRSQLTIIKDKKALDWPEDLWMEVMTLGQLCSSESKKKRPDMTEVYGKLESLHRDMQLKHKIKPVGSADGSLSHPHLSGSEKSYHLLHQSRVTSNHSLAAENSMPLEDVSPFDLQKMYGINESYENLVTKETPGKGNYENLSELSISDDGSKKYRYAVPHVPYWENGEKIPKASEHGFGLTVSANLKPNEIYSVNALQDSSIFVDSKLAKSFPSECIQNFENEQKQVVMDNTDSDSFLQWNKERQLREGKGNTSNVGSYHNSMLLSEELNKMKNKEFPGFCDSFSNDTSSQDELSTDLEQIKKKNLPGYANVFDNNQPSQEIKQSETIGGYAVPLDQNKNSFQPNPHILQSKIGESMGDLAEIHYKIHEFLPPDSLELSESLTSLVDKNLDKDNMKPMFVAKEDLLRAEKLEQLKRWRYEN